MRKKETRRDTPPGNRLWLLAIPALLLLLGIGMIVYPMVATKEDARIQSEVHGAYEEKINAIPDTALETELEKARQYNRALLTGSVPPYSYRELLDPTGSGIMAYVIIPKLGLTLPIRHGTSMETLSKGAGHMPQTSLPVGGKGTHAAISAHSGMAGADMFTGLSELQIGDIFYIEVLGQKLKYEVDQIITVLPSNISALKIDPEGDYVTLITCTPFGVNTHRLLVRGHRVA